MARVKKYYGTNIMIYGDMNKKLIKIGYKGYHSQFRIVCKASSMAEANRICERYGLGQKCFVSNYTSETGNDIEIEEADKYELIICINGTRGDNYIGIEDLLKVEIEKGNR